MMTTLDPVAGYSPASFSLRLHQRIIDVTREESERVISASRTGEEKQSVLDVCLEQGKLGIDALETASKLLPDHTFRLIIDDDDLQEVIDLAANLVVALQSLLQMAQKESEPLAASASANLSRLDAIAGSFERIKQWLAAPMPKTDPATLARGLEEMRRGEGEDVADVLARLQSGGVP